MDIIPYVIDLVRCVSEYNPICAKLGLTCQFARSEYQKVVYRFNPTTECIFPKNVNYRGMQQSQTLLAHQVLIDFGVDVGNPTVDNTILGFTKLNLNEKNLLFFINFFLYLYHWTNTTNTSYDTIFTHLFIQSKKNPILGETMRKFFIDRGVCLLEALSGLIASSTLADVDCLIKCFCLNTRVLPLFEKFLDYPHVLDHLFRMILHYPSREQSLALLMKYFKSNPQIISTIIRFYRDVPKAHTFDEIRKIIIHTIYEVGYNKYDTASQKLIDNIINL